MPTRKEKRLSLNTLLSGVDILIIEDQHSIATMTAALLKDRWGCNITIAESYQATSNILTSEANKFFLVISDLNLPDAKSGEIIDLLVEHQQAIVAITGHFDQSLHVTLIQKGIVDYVLKQNSSAYDYIANLVGRLYLNQFIHVLLIDDSPSIQKATGAFLEKQFLKLHYANNGQEGLDMLNQHPEIKLVLVDSEMPVMDGLSFTAHARRIKNQSELCIIGISSSNQADLSAQFLKNGANDYISKPYSYSEITCRVNQNLSMLSYIEEISKIANLDFLTELSNRRNFFQNGEPVIALANASKQHLVVMILDIDYFKRINDNYGHDIGDQALIHVSNIIKTTLGQHITARLGGEEFGFIIQEKNFSISGALVESLRRNIEDSKFQYNNISIPITASIGATYKVKESLDDMLMIADNHLYIAKNTGRNKVVWDHSPRD